VNYARNYGLRALACARITAGAVDAAAAQLAALEVAVAASPGLDSDEAAALLDVTFRLLCGATAASTLARIARGVEG
jgi:hypothetical protein